MDREWGGRRGRVLDAPLLRFIFTSRPLDDELRRDSRNDKHCTWSSGAIG